MDIVRTGRTPETLGLAEFLSGHRRSKIDFEQLWVGDVIPHDGSLEFLNLKPLRSVRVPKDLLLRFAALKTDVGVIRFARAYGALNLCRHGLPRTHSQFPTEMGKPKFCRKLENEPISMWLALAQKLRAGLRLAFDLHRGNHGTLQDWGLVFADTGWPPEYSPACPVETSLNDLDEYWQQSKIFTWERLWLEDLTNRYVLIANLTLHFSWLGGDWRETSAKIGFAGDLFGILALQFMHAVSNTDGPAICSSCGCAYFPDRRPTANQNHYCAQCGRRAAVRDASRRFRKANPDYYKQLRRQKRSAGT